MKQTLFYILLAVLFVCSCKDNKRKEDATKIVNEWIGKEIKFPENIPCYVSDRKTLSEFCDENFHKEYKILMYVDSAGCSACRLMLSQWKQLIEEADSLFPGRVGFLPFFQPKNIHDINYLFARDGFNYPVFMDFNNKINQLNQFPGATPYQCFLLDNNNRVLVVGNPSLNLKIWELYKEQIAGRISSESKLTTTLVVDKTTHDYRTIRKGSSNPAVFTITNTGNHPLVINRVSTSCGCTNATWDKQPVEPGKTTIIQVEMMPDETGYFNKSVEIYCNANESPLRLSLMGITIE